MSVTKKTIEDLLAACLEKQIELPPGEFVNDVDEETGNNDSYLNFKGLAPEVPQFDMNLYQDGEILVDAGPLTHEELADGIIQMLGAFKVLQRRGQIRLEDK